MLVQYQFPFSPVEPPKKKNTAILAIIFLTITGICIYSYLTNAAMSKDDRVE
jgi:hypothetical protein